MAIQKEITGIKKSYKKEMHLVAPVHMFLECKDSKKFLKKLHIKTVEEFMNLDLDALSYPNIEVKNFIFKKKRKFEKALENKNPIEISIHVLKNKPLKKRLSNWALTIISVTKSLLQSVTRKQREVIYHVISNLFGSDKWVMDQVKY